MKNVSNFSQKVGIFVQKYSFTFFANNSVFVCLFANNEKCKLFPSIVLNIQI